MPARQKFKTASPCLRRDIPENITILDKTCGIVMREVLGRIGLDGLTRTENEERLDQVWGSLLAYEPALGAASDSQGKRWSGMEASRRKGEIYIMAHELSSEPFSLVRGATAIISPLGLTSTSVVPMLALLVATGGSWAAVSVALSS